MIWIMIMGMIYLVIVYLLSKDKIVCLRRRRKIRRI